MEDKQLIEELNSLHRIKASVSLHQKIYVWADRLPEKHRGFYYPLAAFRMGVTFAVLVILVLTTSGVFVAASHSEKGSILYPVKQVLQQTPLLPKSTPTPKLITPTPKPPTVTPEDENNKEINKEKKIQISPVISHGEKEVEGVSTKAEGQNLKPTEKQKEEHNSFLHLPFRFFRDN